MPKWFYQLTLTGLMIIMIIGCGKIQSPKTPLPHPIVHQMPTPETNDAKLITNLVKKYGGRIPRQWGEKVTGVKTMLVTSEKVVALTFDACGNGTKSNGYDAKLIDFLKQAQVPATLFISGKWQRANPGLVKSLAREPLFDLEDHGYLHRPCSVNGKSVYHIKGTASVTEVIEEIENQGRQLAAVTGKKPKFYRSGTDFYDEVAVAIAGDLGYQVISYSVLGDAGATYNREQIKRALLAAKPGSIIIMHMNHPEGETAAGVIATIPLMKKAGFRFVKLADYQLK